MYTLSRIRKEGVCHFSLSSSSPSVHSFPVPLLGLRSDGALYLECPFLPPLLCKLSVLLQELNHIPLWEGPGTPTWGSGSLLLDSPPGLCPCLPFGMCHSPCSGVSPYPLPASSLHFILPMSMGMGNNLLGSSSAPPPAPAMSH